MSRAIANQSERWEKMELTRGINTSWYPVITEESVKLSPEKITIIYNNINLSCNKNLEIFYIYEQYGL